MKTTDVINALKLVRQTRGNIKCEVRNEQGKFNFIKDIEIKESEDISEKTGTRNLHVFIDTDLKDRKNPSVFVLKEEYDKLLECKSIFDRLEKQGRVNWGGFNYND